MEGEAATKHRAPGCSTYFVLGSQSWYTCRANIVNHWRAATAMAMLTASAAELSGLMVTRRASIGAVQGSIPS